MRIEVARRRPTLIRLTPLIDVVFILLVFFMLASSFLDWRAFEVAVPADVAAPDLDVEPILVEIDADGGIRVGGDTVRADELAGAVRDRQQGDPALHPVILRADDDAPLRATIGAFDRLQEGGIPGVSLSGVEP